MAVETRREILPAEMLVATSQQAQLPQISAFGNTDASQIGNM
jgi:hypothetical protein